MQQPSWFLPPLSGIFSSFPHKSPMLARPTKPVYFPCTCLAVLLQLLHQARRHVPTALFFTFARTRRPATSAAHSSSPYKVQITISMLQLSPACSRLFSCIEPYSTTSQLSRLNTSLAFTHLQKPFSPCEFKTILILPHAAAKAASYATITAPCSCQSSHVRYLHKPVATSCCLSFHTLSSTHVAPT